MDTNSIILVFLLLIAVWFDLRERRIPNVLIVAGLVFGVGLAVADGGVDSLGVQTLGAAVGLVILLPFYLMRWVGAGDAKLLAVVGCFTGVSPLLPIVFYTFVIGGVLALIDLLLNRSAVTAFSNVKTLLFAASLRAQGAPVDVRELRPKFAMRVPYAVAIAAGVACWMVSKG